MEWLKSILVVVQILSAIAVIALVLVQQGKGADMGAAFGSGASGSIFGATGSSNFLSRTTAILAGIFFVATLAITYLGAHKTNDVGVLANPVSSVPSTEPAEKIAPKEGTVPK